MKKVSKSEALKQLDDVLALRPKLNNRMAPRIKGLVHDDQHHLITSYVGAVNRLTPPDHPYRTLLRAARLKKHETGKEHLRVLEIEGIVRGLRDDWDADRLETFPELIRSSLFSDFLDAARYLNVQTYADPAAVMATGALEEHLRKLCGKHQLALEKKVKNKIVPLTMGELNDTLGSQTNAVYSKADHGHVSGWSKVRNDVAHAKFGKYSAQYVGTMIDGIKDFIQRNPA